MPSQSVLPEPQVNAFHIGRLTLILSQDTTGEVMEERVTEDMVALAMAVDTIEREMRNLDQDI